MTTNDTGQRVCSRCGEEIAEFSRRCPYCGSTVENDANTSETSSENVNTYNNSYSALNNEQYSSNNRNGELDNEIKASPSAASASSVYSGSHAVRTNVMNTGAVSVKPVSNGLKVLLSVISAVVPGLGQLVCTIIAIVFMNDEDSEDKNKFGRALLVSSLVMFILNFLFWFTIILALTDAPL